MIRLRRCHLRAILKVIGLGVSLQSGSSFHKLGREKNESRLTWSVLAKDMYKWWASQRSWLVPRCSSVSQVLCRELGLYL